MGDPDSICLSKQSVQDQEWLKPGPQAVKAVVLSYHTSWDKCLLPPYPYWFVRLLRPWAHDHLAKWGRIFLPNPEIYLGCRGPCLWTQPLVRSCSTAFLFLPIRSQIYQTMEARVQKEQLSQGRPQKSIQKNTGRNTEEEGKSQRTQSSRHDVACASTNPQLLWLDYLPWPAQIGPINILSWRRERPMRPHSSLKTNRQ